MTRPVKLSRDDDRSTNDLTRERLWESNTRTAAGRPGGARFGGMATVALAHAEQLHLSDAQRTALEQLEAELRQELSTRPMTGNRRVSRQEMRERMSATRERIQSILTQNQLEELPALPPRRRSGADRTGWR